jgi:hypothetical protein
MVTTRSNIMTGEIVPFDGQPPDFGQTVGFCRILAASGLFGDVRGAAQAAVKVMAGREMGFGPIASMTGVHIIKGHVTISAHLMAAAVRRSRDYDYQVKRLTDAACEIDFSYKGTLAGTVTFSIEDARRAGLAQGDNWRKYPKNMLFARAMSNGARWYCPDVFAGPAYTPDELGADVDGETLAMVSPPHNDGPAAPGAGPDDDVPVGTLEPLLRRTGVALAPVLDHYAVEGLDQLTGPQRREALLRLEGRPDVTTDPAGESPATDDSEFTRECFVYDEGVYNVRARAWGFEETANGFDMFKMSFDVLGRADRDNPAAPAVPCEPRVRSWSITLKDDSNARWLSGAVLGLGYDRDDFLGLDPELNGTFDFSGVEFLAACKHGEYRGEHREQWSAVQLRARKALSGKRVRDLNDRLGHVLRDVKASKSARAAGASGAPAGDDIPF